MAEAVRVGVGLRTPSQTKKDIEFWQKLGRYITGQIPESLPHAIRRSVGLPGRILSGKQKSYTPEEALEFALLGIGGGLAPTKAAPGTLGINKGYVLRALKEAGVGPDVYAATKSAIRRLPRSVTRKVSDIKITPKSEAYAMYDPSQAVIEINPFVKEARKRVPRAVVHESIHHQQELLRDKPWMKPLHKISEEIDPVQYRYFPETVEDWLVGVYRDPLEAQAHQLSKEITKKLFSSRKTSVSERQLARRLKQTAKRVEKEQWKKHRIPGALERVKAKPSTGKIAKLRSTEEAIAFGREATPRQITQLEKLRSKSLEKQAKLKQAKDIQGYMNEATKGQFFREALEEAGRRKLKQVTSPYDPDVTYTKTRYRKFDPDKDTRVDVVNVTDVTGATYPEAITDYGLIGSKEPKGVKEGFNPKTKKWEIYSYTDK